MLKLTFLTLALAAAGVSARAQDAATPTPPGPCTNPDSIVVRGNSRVSTSSVLNDAALTAGGGFNYRAAQRAIRALYATGQFEDVQLACQPKSAGTKASIVIAVRERPVLTAFSVTGADRVSRKTVKDKIDLPVGKALDPAQVASVLTRIDSIYESRGYYLARVRPESTVTDGKVALAFRIEEGRHLAISGVRVHGNQKLASSEIVAAMKSKPEGFFWYRRGEFDDEKYNADVGDRIPAAYAARGFVDFQIVRDTVIVDRARGKALIDITVKEGPQYRVGTFDVSGNRRFSAEEIGSFNPFTAQSPTVTDRVKGIVRRRSGPTNVFDRTRWEAATDKLRNAYGNEGYLFSLRINPVEERRTVLEAGDSVHYVDLRWEISEGTPAIINKVVIAGNDFTHESCIRSQLVSLPGDVFNRDRLIRSYQSISNLGFFETPGPTPDVNPANDSGDVNVVFRVKEKKTGNVNFGASAGGYGGIGGFIGLDQPNLFGQCKRASLNWQFGRLQNDFNVSYTDPSVYQSQVQGSVTAYRAVTRFDYSGLGRSIRTGGSVQAGFPVPHSPFSRFAVSYTGERIRYENIVAASNLAGSSPIDPFRSTLGFNYSHDTRIDMPFPTGGTFQSASAQFTGGPLGGNNRYSRYTAEMRTFAPLGTIGGGKAGSGGLKLVLGLNARAGALLGDPGLFFGSQGFTLGGVQYGEPLRGYDEFSITPNGYDPTASSSSASRGSFGNAFFATTVEMGLRVTSSLYTNVFYDAGNVYARARDFDPTRLFRGAGVGVSTVTPLGPLGLDYAYGFDRVDAFGRPAPKWQLHFKLGQLF